MSQAHSHRPFVKPMVDEHPVSVFRLLLSFVVWFSILLFAGFGLVWAALDVQQAPVSTKKAPASHMTDVAAPSDFVYFPAQYVNQATEIEELPAQF